jgi:hypothetical protein
MSNRERAKAFFDGLELTPGYGPPLAVANTTYTALAALLTEAEERGRAAGRIEGLKAAAKVMAYEHSLGNVYANAEGDILALAGIAPEPTEPRKPEGA